MGECIALARYGPHMEKDATGRVDTKQLLAFIDRLRVCTTCGWPEHIHTQDSDTQRVLHSCAHYRR